MAAAKQAYNLQNNTGEKSIKKKGTY